MGILEETIVKAKDFAETVGEKGGEMFNIQKMKIEAAKINSQLSKEYEALGRFVYENIVNDTEPTEGTSDFVDEIAAKKSALSEVNAKIAYQKGMIVCAECHAANLADAVYCAKCGKHISK